MNQISAQVVVSAVIVWLLQAAKRSRLLPWVTAETPQVNRALAVLASLFSTLGIHFTFSVEQGVLTITGLTIAGVGAFAWHWLVSFVSQQLIFQTAVPKTSSALPPELVTAVSEWLTEQAQQSNGATA